MGSSQNNRIATASQSGSSHKGKSCQDCVKEGIPVLPVLESNQLFRASGAVKVNDKIETVTRMVEPGYLYVYYKKTKEMQCYVVGKDGCIRKVDDPKKANNNPSKVAMSSQCKNAGHATPTRYITLNKKDASGGVAIAYSRYKWTENVINRYKSTGYKKKGQKSISAEDLRKARMLDIPNANAKGSKSAYYDISSGGINSCANFNRSKVRFINRKQVDKNFHIIDLSQNVINTHKSMKKVAEKSNSGVFMAILPDPVGKMAHFNSYKNYHASMIRDYTRGTTPKESHERAVAGIIKKITDDADKHGEKHYKSDRYFKHIHKTRYNNVQSQIKRAKQNVTSHKRYAKKLLPYFNDPVWKTIQAYDFDSKSDASALDHREMIALVFNGFGSPEGYKKVIEPLLKQKVPSQENWLIRVFASLDDSLILTLESALNAYESKTTTLSDIGQVGRGYETVKAVSSGMLEFFSKYGTRIPNLKSRMGNSQKRNKALADTLSAVSTELFQSSKGIVATKAMLSKNLPAMATATATLNEIFKDYNKLVVLSGAFSVSSQRELPVPLFVKAKTPEMLLEHISYLGRMDKLKRKRGAEYKLTSAQQMSKNEANIMALVYIRRLKNSDILTKDFIATFKIKDPVVLKGVDAIADMHLTRARVDKITQGGQRALSVGLAGFQAQAYIYSLYATATAKNGFDRTTNALSATNAAFTFTSALVEIQAVNALSKGAPRTAALLGVKAAGFGMGAAIAEMGFNIFQFGDGLYRRDFDYALYAFANAGVTLTMGVAFFAASAGFAGSAFTTTAFGSLVATSAPILLAFPVGWLLLAIAATGASLWLYFQMHHTNDKNVLPLEYWLDSGVFGRDKLKADTKNPFRKGFINLADELNALAKANQLFIVDMRWHKQQANLHVEVEVSPYDKTDKVVFAFHAKVRHKNVVRTEKGTIFITLKDAEKLGSRYSQPRIRPNPWLESYKHRLISKANGKLVYQVFINFYNALPSQRGKTVYLDSVAVAAALHSKRMGNYRLSHAETFESNKLLYRRYDKKLTVK